MSGRPPYDEFAGTIEFGMGKGMRTVRTLRELGGRDRDRKRMALERVAKTMVEHLEHSNWRAQPGPAGDSSDPLPRRREFPREQLAVEVAAALEAALARDPTILPALMSKIRPIKWDSKGVLAGQIADRLRASWWFRHGPLGESAGGPPRPRRDDRLIPRSKAPRGETGAGLDEMHHARWAVRVSQSGVDLYEFAGNVRESSPG